MDMDDAHLVSDESMNSDECGVVDHDSSDYMPSDNSNIDGFASSSSDSLDDLMFELGRSLKRKACGRVGQRKNLKDHKGQKKQYVSKPRSVVPFSRCNTPYFAKVIKCLADPVKEFICQKGFGSLLMFDGCGVPRKFAQFVVDHVNVKFCDIVTRHGRIPLSADCFHSVLGIPNEGCEIVDESEAVKDEFLGIFGRTSMPSVKFFGSKILLKEDMTVEDSFRCFMVVALATFICPNSSTLPSTKYLLPLIDIESVNDWNWSKFGFQWLIAYISKYQKDRRLRSHYRSTLGGCIYALTVQYLDFLDFGTHTTSNCIPRINVWKGSMIKEFSRLDRSPKGKYGQRPVKHINMTCYAPPSVNDNEADHCTQDADNSFMHCLNLKFGDNLVPQAKQDISAMFSKFKVDENGSSCFKTQSLVVDIMKYIYDAPGGVFVQKTAPQSANVSCPASPIANNIDDTILSGDTEKLSEQDSKQDAQGGQKKPSEQSENTSSDHGLVKKKRGRPLGSKKKLSSSQESENSVSTRTRGRVRLSQKSPLSQVSKRDPVCISDGKAKECNMDDGDGLNITSNNFVPRGDAYGMKNNLTDNSVSLDHMLTPKDMNTSDGNSKAADDTLGLDPLDGNDAVCKDININHGGKPASASNTVSQGLSHDMFAPKQFVVEEMPPANTTASADLHNPSAVQVFPKMRMTQRWPGNYKRYSSGPNHDNWLDEFLNDCRPIIDEHNDYHAEGFDVNTRKNSLSPSKCTRGSENTKKMGCNTDSSSPLDGRPNFVQEPIYMQTLDDSDDDIPVHCTQKPSSPITYDDCPTPICAVTAAGKVIFVSSQSTSPEVEITGNKQFSNICNNMVDESDKLYDMNNKSNYATTSAISSGAQPAQFANKRVVQASKYKASPYVDNKVRFSVTHEEMRIWDNLVRVSDMEEHKYKFAIDYDKVRVMFGSLGRCLKRKGLVDNFIINAFCRKLFKDTHPKYSKKHFFFHITSEFCLEKYPSELRKKEMFAAVKRGFDFASFTRSLNLVELLFFPTLHQDHWFVLVVFVSGKKFVILDSLYNQESKYHKEIDDKLISNFIKLWRQLGLFNVDFSAFQLFYPKVPRQGNIQDCGIFAMKFMELWDPRVQLMDKFGNADINNIRVQYANQMMFSTHNELEESIDFISQFDPKVDGKYAHQM